MGTNAAPGHEASMASALVLTGETGPQALADVADDDRPDYVLDRIDPLVPEGARMVSAHG